MKQGTVSVIIGCHSLVHSFYVWRSWRKLYGKYPCFWETVCIAIHDIGHWGTDYLDNLQEKKDHWKLGARVARKLFGDKGYALCAGHCESSGVSESRMFKADKYSRYMCPHRVMVLETYVEPKIMGNRSREEHIMAFRKAVARNIESGTYGDTHRIFLGLRQIK